MGGQESARQGYNQGAVPTRATLRPGVPLSDRGKLATQRGNKYRDVRGITSAAAQARFNWIQSIRWLARLINQGAVPICGMLRPSVLLSDRGKLATQQGGTNYCNVRCISSAAAQARPALAQHSEDRSSSCHTQAAMTVSLLHMKASR